MTNDTVKPKRAHNIWKIIFTISLALNIAVLGAIGGAAVRFSKSPIASEGHLKERQIRSIYIRALSKEQRRELGRKMRDQEENNQDSRAMIAAGFQEAIRILRSENFNKEAFEAVAQGHSKISNDRLKKARSILISHITYMNFDQRLAYADRIEKALNNGAKSKR